MDHYVADFFAAYAEYLEWPERDVDAVARRLCEEYHYSTEHGRSFLLVAFGWLWGRGAEPAAQASCRANCFTALVKAKLDETYATVAAENGWDDH